MQQDHGVEIGFVGPASTADAVREALSTAGYTIQPSKHSQDDESSSEHACVTVRGDQGTGDAAIAIVDAYDDWDWVHCLPVVDGEVVVPIEVLLDMGLQVRP